MTRRPSVAVAVAACLVALVLGACSSDDGAAPATTAPTCAAGAPERLAVEVLDERPHDPTAFTQGLLVVDGDLYESTGQQGESTVREVDPTTGEVRRTSDLDPELFGEGLTAVGDDRLVQLTWKDGRALVWDRADLTLVDEHAYDGEGWGITTLDDGRLVMSDGSDRLAVRDPDDFAELDRWTVERSDGPADQLNELEWDGERLWANRWQTDEIVRIDPTCHRVDAVVDAAALTERAREAADPDEPIDVLNGIAHLPGTDRFLVTGKDWPVLYEVRFVPA
ncbi:glutaminyl-peptide cyclotransferase [Dermatobacter hominis]|uniref:glutaminyl-peptide cyclotransferase n=1 Tax=Dermatobacter hominis TaxID=2884263 RepID=UPI001D10EB87|nr:glutaminyl-peptide cyclotransferase [Dermatobacter hominis]UDY35662.1 glutaminyl-peptide cyclotransferase [Dermatobacter hominis]